MLKRYSAWLYVLIVVGSIGLAGCQSTPAQQATATNPEQTTIIKSANDDREYSALLLPNGLQVVLVSDPSLENSAASLAVGVGSAQDPEHQQGLAHYLEHMLFLGTEKFPEPDGFMKYTQANGGMTNAFTAFDKTNYLFQINAGKFDEALDRFSDYFKQPTFDPHFSDKERSAVNNEWSLQKSQDTWNLFRLEGLTANPANPKSKFSIGNLESLSDKPNAKLQDDLIAFYNRYYSANIMRLTLVGKQPLPELKALAEKHFSSIANKNIVPPTLTVPGITAAETGKTIHYQPIKNLKALYVDFPVKSNKDQWRLKPNEFVNNLITSEEPGTLGEQLRRKGLVKSVTAYVNAESYGPDGYLRVRADLTDAGLQQQDDIIASIFAYVDLIKREGVKENYYRELQAMGTKDFDSKSKPEPVDQAVQLTQQQFDLPVANLLNADYVYERFDAKTIQALLAQLDKRKARIWYISAQEKVDKPIPYFEGKYATGNISAQDFARWDQLAAQQQFNLPPLNNLFTDKPAPIVDNLYLKPHVVVSQPGVEALLTHPEFYREDKGVLTVQLNVNFAQSSARNVVLSRLLNEVYNKQHFTLSDRAGRASLGITISLSATNSQAFFINGYTSKHPQLLQELLQGFATLEMTDKAFHEALDSYTQMLLNIPKNQVYQQLYYHAGRLTNKAQWRSEELLAEAGKVSLQDLVDYHQAVKRDPLVRLFAVGNYTEADVKQMALVAATILPGTRNPAQRAVPAYASRTPGRAIEFRDSVALADSAVLQVWLRDARSDDEQAQLSVLNALFGNAFFMQLRTNEQLGYVVSSDAFPIDDYPGFATVVQSSNSDVTKIKTRMDKFRKEYLATLKATDSSDIVQARDALIANETQKPTDFYAEAKRYTDEFILGKYAFDARERNLAALDKVTKADLVKLYEELLLKPKSTQMLLQLRGTNFKDHSFAPLK